MLSLVGAHLVAVVVAWVIVPLHVLAIVQLDVEDVLQIVPHHVLVIVQLGVVDVLQNVRGHVLAFVLQAVLLIVPARVGDVGEDVQIAIKTIWGF